MSAETLEQYLGYLGGILLAIFIQLAIISYKVGTLIRILRGERPYEQPSTNHTT